MLRFQAARALKKPPSTSKVQPSLSLSQLLHHPRISRSFSAIQQIRHASAVAPPQLQPAPLPASLPEGNAGINVGGNEETLVRRGKENNGPLRVKWTSPKQQSPRQFNDSRPENQQQKPNKHYPNKNHYKKHNASSSSSSQKHDHHHDTQSPPKLDVERQPELSKPPPSWWPFLVPGELSIASKSKDVQLDWIIKTIKSHTTTSKSKDLMDEFKWTERNIVPLNESVRHSPEVYRYTQTLLHNIYSAKRQDPLNYSLPSLTQILQLQRASNATGHLNKLFEIAISQTDLVTQTIVDAAKYTRGLNVSETHMCDATFADQDAFWSLVFTKPSLAAVPDAAQSVEFPELKATRLAILKNEGIHLKSAIEKLLPWHNPSSVSHLAPALVAWYLTFLLCRSTPKPAQGSFVVIRQMLDKLFSGLEVGNDEIMHILSEYPQVRSNLHAISKSPPTSPKPKPVPLTRVLNVFHDVLSEAYKSRNAVRCKQLLDEFLDTCSVGKDVTPEERELQAGIFNYLVFVYCALRCDAHLDQALGYMASKGFVVDSKTYTSMISGWRETREIHKISALWQMLIDRKAPLDDIVWSARISAYERHGMLPQAVQALFEMDAMHKAALESRDAHTSPQPTINVVNPVLTGLFRRRDVDGVRQILSWAEQRNIELNLASYNILLEGMLKCGLNTEAPLLLEAMRDHSIDPDIATYTILLDHALKNKTSGATAGEQVAAVLDIISTFEQSDISMQSATYAKMLHIVLKSDTASSSFRASASNASQSIAGSAANGLSGANTSVSETSASGSVDVNASTTGSTASATNAHRGNSAAQVILEHMSTHNVPLTTHIYTILVEHYFACRNGAAVHALIQDWKLQESLRDPVFWEVVISGFARLGATAMADHYTGLFFRLWPRGRMAMGAQTDLLLFLLNEGREEQAAHLVAREMEHAKETQVQPNDRYWDHRFWHVARDNLGSWMG